MWNKIILEVILKNGLIFFESCWKEGFKFCESYWKKFNPLSHIPEKVQVFESFWEKSGSILWVVFRVFNSFSRVQKKCSILWLIWEKTILWVKSNQKKVQFFGSYFKKFNYKSQSKQNNTILRVIIKKINSESNIQRTKFLSHFEEKIQFFESFWDTVQFFESFWNKSKSLSHIQEKVFNSLSHMKRLNSWSESYW